MPIQGTAADGIKRAQVLLYERLEPFGAHMRLCVHDELVVEAPNRFADEVLRAVEATMIDGMATYIKSVPIIVEAKIQSAWG